MADTHDETYSYTPLPTPGHIRLLTLKASKSRSADLHGELIEYPLEECKGDLHYYEALSYVWGSERKPRHIWIGARKLYITESLHAALLRLRNSSADRSLWVDAICINQKDDDRGSNQEKSIQVQHMANVYSKASRVRVWLGEAADGSDEALDCIDDAGAAEGSSKLPDDSLQPIRNLLARDWFKRIWVLQEVAAAQHVVLMCGAASIDGYAFCVGLQTLHLHQSGQITDLQDYIGSIVYLIRRSIFRLSKRNRQDSQEASPKLSLNVQPLGQLVDMYRNREATDQRDKVFALLGMCSEDVPDDLLPDYSKAMTWHLLFGNLARYVFGTEAQIQVVDTTVAAVRTKGTVLGHISSFRTDEHRYDMQVLTIITSWDTERRAYNDRIWKVPTSAVPVQVGDIIYLLEGVQNIAILRPEMEFFSVVSTSGRWDVGSPQHAGEKADVHEVLLAWDWTPQNELIPPFINLVSAKSILTQNTDTVARRKAIADALLSAKLDEKAEPILLELETEFHQRPAGITSAKLDCSANIVYIHLRQGRLDEAEKRYTDVYQLAKATDRTKWLSQSISQYLIFSPAAGNTAKERIWRTLKSILDQKTAFPQAYVEIHRELADIFAEGTLADATLLIDVGEILTRNAETSRMLANSRDNNINIPESLIKAAEEDVVKAAARHGRQMIELFFEQRGDQVPVTEDVVKAAAKNSRKVVELLFEKRGDQVPVTEDVVKAAAGNHRHGRDVLELLFEQKGDQVPVTEDVVKAAAENSRNVVELLFEKRGDQVPVTEDVVKAAAENSISGRKIMELFFEQRGDQVPVTEDVVKAAAKNRYSGWEMMCLLFGQRGDQVPVTEDVVKAAARNSRKAVKLLFEQRGDQVPVTKDVVKAAAWNYSRGPRRVLELLFEKRGDQVPVTEDVVMAAAQNDYGGGGVMCLLFGQRGDQVPVTEDVVKAAARYNGREVVELLFEERGDQVPVTEDVVKAAAGNSREVVELLFEQRGDQVPVTEDVVKAAARNSRKVVELLFEERGDQVPVTEDVVKAAVRYNGREVVELLFEKRGDQVPVTEDVVKAAARNYSHGRDVLELLFEKRGDQVPVTEDVVKAAAKNGDHGRQVIKLFFEERGDQVPVTKDVVKAAARHGRQVMELFFERRGDQVPIIEDNMMALFPHQ